MISATTSGSPADLTISRSVPPQSRMMLPEIAVMDLPGRRETEAETHRQLKIGSGPASILVEFALKRSATRSSLLSERDPRLIRASPPPVRHPDNKLPETKYKEIKQDQHPIIVISASDIVALLTSNV
jgi:hypothetical protein